MTTPLAQETDPPPSCPFCLFSFSCLCVRHVLVSYDAARCFRDALMGVTRTGIDDQAAGTYYSVVVLCW